ncbi:MAG: twin-arginine translocase TatA/TatE family subunit [Streptosporangiales bacterium]|nr:twin-arginine translocase TatA/TatE family subunit [Streptosporangiales bacterium]
MPNIGATELIIIAVVIVVLFGATKLPTFARSVGRSMRIFKSEAKGLQDDDEADDKDRTTDDATTAAKEELTEKPRAAAAEDVTERRQAGS